jgi:hypothetical protein
MNGGGQKCGVPVGLNDRIMFISVKFDINENGLAVVPKVQVIMPKQE